jgi:PKD repeat protein
MMADVNGDGLADVVGFGGSGVYISLSTGKGFTTGESARWVYGNYGSDRKAGGWKVSDHPRMMADVNGDGLADIVGFANAGVNVSISTGTGFTPWELWIKAYGYTAGGWRVGSHPRMMADVNGDGLADVVGFSANGVQVSLSTGTGFTSPELWVEAYGYTAGGWRVGIHPRMMTDVNNDGFADIVGFASYGVDVSLSRYDSLTNNLPVANFIATPSQGEAPLTVTLDAGSSTDSDGTIVEYNWSASDGQTASSKRVNMTFPNAGTYSINLVVTDDKDAQSTNTAQQTVTVTAKPVPKVVPVAHLSISPTNGETPLTVSLNGSGSSDSDGTIVEYNWSASDGQTAFGIKTQITFDKSETYTITLTVTDNDGLTATAQKTVTATNKPPPKKPHTLILTNHEKLAQLYGSTEADKVVSKLNELANYPDVKGLVIQVENDSTVAAAYAARGNDYDNKNQANAVADAIKQLILNQWNDNLENVVIVGDDRVMPFYRIKDGSCEDNRTGSDCTPDIWTFTDDFYTDRNPSSCSRCANPKIYIPDITSGRLIESPSQIIGVIDTFLADDTLNIDNAAVVAYDFLKDGAQAYCKTLRVADISSNCALIGESWESSDFKEQILNTYHDITSINNHANYNLFGTPESGRVYAKDFANTSIDFSGTLFYTLGCHSGQNVSNELDLPESLAILRANYIANTGYGWGYTEGIGLSEELMWNLTKELIKSQMTLGKALMKAKIQYFADQPYIKQLEEKIVAESTLYGLPMYKINSSASPPALAITTDKIQTTQENGLQKDSYAYTLAKTTSVATTSDDNFYSLDGAIAGGEGEPVLPKLAQDVSNPEKALHGMVFRGGRYTTVNAAPPLQRYQTTTGYLSPERTFTAPNWYPSTFFTPNTVQLDTRRKDMLVATAGQYNPNERQLRIFDNMDFDFYYHAQANDWTEPTVYLTNSSLNANTAIVTVTTSDASDIKEVVVAYTDGKGIWNSENLTNGGETWSGNFAANANTEFFIQSVDNAGNVAVDDNEGEYFKVTGTECMSDVWVDGKCMPTTTGSDENMINPDGTGISDAQFFGGWSEDGSPYKSTVTYRGGEATITQVIRFDPAHIGQEVDIFILLNLHVSPPSGPQLWHQVSGTSGFITWDNSPETIEAFETHTIVAGKSKVIGPYNLGVLKGLPTSDVKFEFGYRINNGTIITTGVPTTLKVQ